MTDSYKVPKNYGIAEFFEKKSRFIGQVWNVSTEQSALDILKEVKSKYRDATHNVYAYRLHDNQIMRFSDDGEPSGTAGMPLLDVFLKQDIQDFLCISTRYFGGIMLGAGGLVRAYSHSAVLALKTSEIATMQLWATCEIIADYSMYESIMRIIAAKNAIIENIEYLENVKITFVIDFLIYDFLAAEITEYSAGKIEIYLVEKKYRAI